MELVMASFPTGVQQQTPALCDSAAMATSRGERFAVVDALRGAALLGILVMNIEYFAGLATYRGFPQHGFGGLQGHLDLILVYVQWLFIRGKMRGIFSMLFGAGVILLTSRAEQRGEGQQVADIYLRRNMLLCVFGILHACLIWEGDILFNYGMSALLFLYPCRKLAPKSLMILGVALALTIGPIGLLGFTHTSNDLPLRMQASAIEARRQVGLPVTVEQQKIERSWQDLVEQNRFNPRSVQREIAQKLNETYFEGISHRMSEVLGANFYARQIDPMTDTVPAMLLGMGLLRTGFLTGELSSLTYMLTALIGFGISIPLYLVALARVFASQFDFITIDEWLVLPYYFYRVPAMLAVAALLILLIKSGVFRIAQRMLAAVGQTALTNYLMTSLICQFVFLWGPWKIYGQLEFYQSLYVVLGVWAINLTFSVLWLRWFAFGPLEWVWRSLTYLKAQPMRIPQ
jgi:uncharacterized protein